jgi:hypothetical protein
MDWTGVVGIAGIAGTLVGQQIGLRGSRGLARDERLFKVRSEAYAGVLRAIHLRMRQVGRVQSLIGHEDLPAPTDEDMAEIDSLVGAFGSEEVREAVKEFGDLVYAFRGRAESYRQIVAQGRGRPIPMEEGARQAMEAARKKVGEQVLSVERLMQQDLGLSHQGGSS